MFRWLIDIYISMLYYKIYNIITKLYKPCSPNTDEWWDLDQEDEDVYANMHGQDNFDTMSMSEAGDGPDMDSENLAPVHAG